MSHPSNLSVAELLSSYQETSLSPVAVAQATLEKAEVLAFLHAFVRPLERERILAEAKESEARWHAGKPKGRLDGVPIRSKMLSWPAAGRLLAGSTLVDPKQAWAEDAGGRATARSSAIILGKTTTPEFGWKGVTDSPLTGATRNPWGSDDYAGRLQWGRRGGGRLRHWPCRDRDDAAGSVRLPGSFCGLVALKATRG